jgi:hypothetical protein
MAPRDDPGDDDGTFNRPVIRSRATGHPRETLKTVRLGVISTHPIQYYAPIFQMLARLGNRRKLAMSSKQPIGIDIPERMFRALSGKHFAGVRAKGVPAAASISRRS